MNPGGELVHTSTTSITIPPVPSLPSRPGTCIHARNSAAIFTLYPFSVSLAKLPRRPSEAPTRPSENFNQSMIQALEQQYLPRFLSEKFLQRPSAFRRTADWRIDRAHFAGREARLRLLQWRGQLPIQPQYDPPLSAPGIHLVLRDVTPDLTAGVYTGVDWSGLDKQRGEDVLIYSWATEIEAYEFCATVRGETDFARCFDRKLVAQHQDHDQSNSSPPQSSTNPWEGIQ